MFAICLSPILLKFHIVTNTHLKVIFIATERESRNSLIAKTVLMQLLNRGHGKMNLKKERFIGGFLVLGFVIFIVGFLAGMVAIAFIPINADSTTLAFMVFIFGFITGMVTVALLLVIVKFRELTRKAS
jgi:hypothetical protein